MVLMMKCNIYLFGIWINRVLGRYGYEIKKKDALLDECNAKKIDFNDFLSAYFMNVEPDSFFLMQIGANDGKMCDPIFKYVNKLKLKGLLVEPQKDVFLKLKENYKNNKNLVFANVAISHKNEIKKMYRVRNDIIGLYEDFSGVASFDYNHVKRAINQHYKRLNLKEKATKYIISEEVKTLTFQNILNKNKICYFNFLQIDTEGFDFEIIKMINFNKYKPNIINYEHRCLTDIEKKESWKYLRTIGYNLFVHDGDTTAYFEG